MIDAARAGLWLMVGVLALGQSACMTMRPVESAADGRVPAEIAAGDRISILDAGGVTTELVVTAVGTDFIEGTAEEDGGVLRIPAADVREIRQRRFAAGKTAGLGLGVALALFVETLSNASFFP